MPLVRGRRRRLRLRILLSQFQFQSGGEFFSSFFFCFWFIVAARSFFFFYFMSTCNDRADLGWQELGVCFFFFTTEIEMDRPTGYSIAVRADRMVA